VSAGDDDGLDDPADRRVEACRRCRHQQPVLYAPPPQPSAITITETSNCKGAPSVSVNSKTWVHSPGYYQKEADDFRNKLERPEQQCRPELLLSTGASVIHLICRQERQERELRIRLSYR
jgi:5-methylcytosine-specific restriction endonuclease McrA